MDIPAGAPGRAKHMSKTVSENSDDWAMRFASGLPWNLREAQEISQMGIER